MLQVPPREEHARLPQVVAQRGALGLAPLGARLEQRVAESDPLGHVRPGFGVDPAHRFDPPPDAGLVAALDLKDTLVGPALAAGPSRELSVERRRIVARPGRRRPGVVLRTGGRCGG
ncbi:MAG: hypothetical protein RML45_01555 [Acetobacteraceae bacterium]|nr:hypothetical protein [Acetobacteraceae bacterium]